MEKKEFDNIIQECEKLLIGKENINEGFVKGYFAGGYSEMKDDFKSIVDLFHMGSYKVEPRVMKVTNELIKFVENSKFNGAEKIPVLKFFAKQFMWRWYYYIDNSHFQLAIKDSESGYSIRNRFISWKKDARGRAASVLETASKNKNGLINLIKTYQNRVGVVAKLAQQKGKDKPGYVQLLRQAIIGLRDLSKIIHYIVYYHE